MPRKTNDLIQAASTCCHLNIGDHLPHYIVIRSPRSNTYAITTLDAYRAHDLHATLSDWVIAINLSSSDLMTLMGIIPTHTMHPDLTHTPKPSPQSPTSTPKLREVNNHASGPQDL